MNPSVYNAIVSPANVAIVGASDDPYRTGGRIQRYLLERYHYSGDVYPVNPRRKTVQGVPAYASILDIERPLDLALIQAPAVSVPDHIADCVKQGVKAALIISSGFREVGDEGAALEREIRDVLAHGKTRVLGPNSVGVVSVRANLAASIQTGLDQERFNLTDGAVGFLTQSGAMGAFTLNKCQGRRIGLSTVISTGNELDISYTEMLYAMVEDPQIDGIVGYIEGISNGQEFLSACARAQELGKRLGFMKVGRSNRGTAAVASHTGAMAGVDAVYEAVFEQFGATRISSIDELSDFAQMVNARRNALGRRVTILTTSGGAGALAADYCDEFGLTLADWSEEWRTEMAKILPNFAGFGNPIDMTGAGGRPELLEPALDLAQRHPDTDMILVLIGNLERTEDILIPLLQRKLRETEKPVAVAWIGGSGRPLNELAAAKIPSFADPLPALRMLAWSAHPKEVRRPNTTQYTAIRDVNETIAKARLDGRTQLSESESTQVLRAYGIPTTDQIIATDAEGATNAALEIGFPVVLKASSHLIAHKTEIGGVRLNLQSEDQVYEAAQEILRNMSEHELDVQPELLVQEMVQQGVELILGITNDPVFGPVIMVGMGGTLAEVLKDAILLVPPVTPDIVQESLNRLRGSALFYGYRGSKPLDVNGLQETIVSLSRLAQDLGDSIAELDINPFLVAEKGGRSVALDALIILKPSEG